MSHFRWKIFLANLDPVIGSEQSKTRPVLIISDEEINQILPIVNVLPITKKKENRLIYPNETLILANISGLKFDSIILSYQIRTLDKSRLIKEIGEIDDKIIQDEIINSICFQLGI